MANRLSKIVTRTGDDGMTGLADCSRLPKEHPRIAAMGSVDELNSQIGVLLAEDLPPDIRAVLLMIQNDLFDLGGALALPGQDQFAENKIAWLDERISHYNAELLPLREFVLPGGSRAGAQCHVVRSVARRAERELVMLVRSDAVPQHALPYLNRLSDFLFVLSRCINKAQSVPETLWQRDK
jgi:cob(I)alamin adenosyltransferase